ncbi:MAG: chitobiase/beta-hexosaminidase C-terminal domain-containing protein [Clostridiales bacterium]|nr:chitobiase/beta-hexosaminidase C-terminal domain-containing protein [Clostridiales bacterium]
MKCIKCGAELKQGCLYCSVCGYESQILPDYSVLEDDYLRSLLKEENGTDTTEQKESEQTKKQKKSDNPYRLLLIILCCLLLFGIAAGIGVKLYIDEQNANSYDYQMEMAQKEETEGNYDEALAYYNAALVIQPNDVEARTFMADIYMKQKNYDSALVLYMEIIKLDETNREAYENLITIYEEKGEYDSILALSDDVKEADILELFQPYLVAPPIISPLGGDYEDSLIVTLFSLKGYDIYYTIDGTEPDTMNGILYRDDNIEFEDAGDYELKAVCINEKGISSEVATAQYHVEENPPSYPSVSPDGGEIWGETYVTITAEENCSIYYTWDGSDPTEASAKYMEPLLVPEGNNVLSVLVVNDKNGLSSEIYRSNFIYVPQ